jgi:hypothetical protein
MTLAVGSLATHTLSWKRRVRRGIGGAFFVVVAHHEIQIQQARDLLDCV